jgi:hypothetical protein
MRADPPPVCEITSPHNGDPFPPGALVVVQGHVRPGVGPPVTVNRILIDGLGNESPPVPFPAMLAGTDWNVNIPTPNDGVTVAVRFVLVTPLLDCTDTVTIALKAL